MNNDINNLKYVEVPMIVLLDNDISSTSKLLMGLITTLTMKEGFCYASNKYLSNLLKVSRRTITSCISSLRRKNYIKVENDPNMRKIYLANFF
ncbi:MAG: helix-turn-helix domain-containing protein [Bacilli bacterium]